MKMKHLFLFTIAAAAGLMMASCEQGADDIIPEGYEKANTDGITEGALRLDTEGTEGQSTRTAIGYTSVKWVDGDVVSINGNDYTVKVSDDKAYTEAAVTEAAQYYGYFGCEAVANAQTTTPTVNIPSHYLCTLQPTTWLVDLPMAAYCPGNTSSLYFRHLTAAMYVMAINRTGFDNLYIDSVQVVSATQNLCGPVTLDLTDDNFGLAPSDGDNRTATVYFPRESVKIKNGYALTVQVPILPIAAKADDLTVKVFAHNKTSVVLEMPGIAPANYDYNYSRTKAAPALARNVMSNATIVINPDEEFTTTFDHSLFTISDNSFFMSGPQKVRFSQGNLQRVDGAWRFADHQYDIFRSWSETSCDLFYWETEGNYGSEKVISHIKGGPGDVVDWGVNAISNGGNTANLWKTLNKAEWNHIFIGRSGSCFARARLFDERNGVILFPDNYVHPAGVPAPIGVNVITSGTVGNKYTADQWAAMEGAGAVFLPATYSRCDHRLDGGSDYNSSKVFYWTSQAHEYAYYEKSAYCVLFYLYNSYFPDGIHDRMWACPVRLVRNAN
jgi:hypothetical protein